MGTHLRTATRIIVLITCLLLIVGGTRPVLAHSEPITVQVSVQPVEPGLDEEVEIRVLLFGAESGIPALGAEVTVIGNMPAHKMMPIETTLVRGQKRNEHVGKLRFPMVGPWEVTVDVMHQAERDQAKFDIDVKIPTSERDEGTATYALTLNFPKSASRYPVLVLIGSLILIAGIVEAAWINRYLRNIRQRKKLLEK